MIIVGISAICVVLGIAYLYPHLSPVTFSGTIMKVNGTNFSANYTITNAKIVSMPKEETNPDIIILKLQTKGNGHASMTMPRSVLESTTPNGTSDFTLLSEVPNPNLLDSNIDKRTLTDITFHFLLKKAIIA